MSNLHQNKSTISGSHLIKEFRLIVALNENNLTTDCSLLMRLMLGKETIAADDNDDDDDDKDDDDEIDNNMMMQ